MKKVFLLMLSVILPTVAWCANGDIFTSLTEEGIQMKFKVRNEENKTCYVYGVNTSGHNTTNISAYAIDPLTEGKVTIPASANGYTVTYIGAYAFFECTAVTSVVIPDGVQFIDKGAFERCSGLLSITIPSSVTEIKEDAFFYCTGLQAMTIEDGLTTIAAEAFYHCTSLEAVSIPSGVTTIGSSAFYGCTALESIEVPSSVEEMCYNSFEETAWYNNQPDGLVYIGDFLLRYKGTIPDDAQLVVRDGTKGIADMAFSYSIGRRHSVLLPNSVTKIGDRAFYQSFMANITLSKNLTTIGEYAFSRSALTHVVIPGSVTTIPEFAFYGCSSLTSVTLGSSVSSVGYAAFEGCNKLASVTIGTSTPPVLTSNPFNDVSNNATLQVPKDSKSAYEAADYWKDFKTITELPSNYGSNLSITTDAGQLSSWIPVGYDEIICLNISGSINATDIAEIKQMSNLETLNVTASLNGGIPSQTFQNHQHLSSVSFTGKDDGKFGTRIGAYAFDGCTSLTSYNGLIASLGDFCFRNTNVGGLTLSAEEYWEYDGEDLNGPYTDSSTREFYQVGKNPIFAADRAYFTIKNECELTGNFTIDNSVYTGIYSSNESTLYALPNRNSYSNSTIRNIADYAVSGNSDLISFSMESVTTIGDGFLYKCPKLRSITCPNGNSAFAVVNDVLYSKNMKTLIKYPCAKTAENMTIPSTVEQINKWAFEGTQSLNCITIEATTPPALEEGAFDEFSVSTITLVVPYGSKAAYEAADSWKNFGTINEMGDDITISSAGMGTFCSTHALDFSGTDDIKAYIVSAFKPSTGEVTLTRITDVPANTGIVVKGDADTYSIPWGAGETVVANMLVGVTENTVLNKVDGDYTNYILAKKNGNLGFYAVSDGSTLSAGKAYLPLPTAQLPSGAGVRQMTMIFDDETTGIQQTISSAESNKDYYDLQGRRVSTPTHGIYIVNGKKVVIK